MNGSRCDFGLFLIIKFLPLRPESWVVRDCLALKWLKPGLRERIFPFFVIFNLFEYDLFVFILLFRWLQLILSGLFYMNLILCNLPLLNEALCPIFLLKTFHPYIWRDQQEKVLF